MAMLLFYVICLGAGALPLGLYYLLTFFEFGAKYGGSPLNFMQRILSEVALYLAGVTLFGLVGWAGTFSGWDPIVTLWVTVAAGLVPPSVLNLLRKLDADAARRKQAEDQRGTVVTTIPGEKAGPGRVNLSIRGREVEYSAVTAGAELPAGTKVRVVGVLDADTVEVASEIDYEMVWKTFRSQPRPEGESQTPGAE